jgi:hypothetical protein
MEHNRVVLVDVYATPEWRLRTRLEFFSFSVELLERNYEELVPFVTGIEQVKKPLDLLAVGEAWKLDELLKEVSFRLHNYLASAKSLVDHARTMYRQVYAEVGTFLEFPVETQRRFENDGLVQFVHGLREMAQHYQLPNVSWRATFGSTFTLAIMLRKSDLLRYTGWKSAAKSYIAAQDDDELSIRETLEAYHSKVIDFYVWLSENLQRIHAAEFEKLSAMQLGELQKNAEHIFARLHEGVSSLEGGRGGTVRDVLSFLLTPAELRRLYEYERDSQQWVDRAVQLIEIRIAMPPDLITRLRQIAAHITPESSAG